MTGHAQQQSAMSCAKMAEQINMSFRLWTRMGPRKHVLLGLHIGTTWQIRLKHSCVAVMLPFCQITLTTCYYYYSANTDKE